MITDFSEIDIFGLPNNYVSIGYPLCCLLSFSGILEWSKMNWKRILLAALIATLICAPLCINYVFPVRTLHNVNVETTAIHQEYPSKPQCCRLRWEQEGRTYQAEPMAIQK